MASILLLSRRYNGGPSGPLCFVEKILVAIFTVIVLGGITALVIAGISSANTQNEKMKGEWDTGNSRPTAEKLVRDSSADVSIDVPKELDSVNPDWETCSRKSCKRTDIQHYPMVYSIGTLRLPENNCFIGALDNPVDHLMVTGIKGGGTYRLTYAADGKRITVCPTSPRQDQDKLVIWSDHPAAER